MNISYITFVFVSQLLTDLQTDIVLDLVVEVVISHFEPDIIRNGTFHWLNMFLRRQKSADVEARSKNPSHHFLKKKIFSCKSIGQKSCLVWSLDGVCANASILEATVNLLRMYNLKKKKVFKSSFYIILLSTLASVSTNSVCGR